MTNLIMRSKMPAVLEFPFDRLSERTPNELFYVRNHFDTPQVDIDKWTLSLEGEVDKPLKLDFASLLSLPAKTISATLECAGNNRVYLEPTARGVQWQMGGVSTATWTGVPLKEVLKRAGIKESTVEIVFEGADRGVPTDAYKPDGDISFARSLPLEKAMSEDVLLAYEMNGERLSPAHGFPLRLIVPGWYAVASVKWLERIIAVKKNFHGFFQSVDYSFFEMENGIPVNTSISEMLVKSQIASPQAGERLKAGETCTISGAAWSGAAPVESVEVSFDNGDRWQQATLDSERRTGLWTLWHFDWTPGDTGPVTMLSRARDALGETQPIEHDRNRCSYLINFCLPVVVEII